MSKKQKKSFICYCNGIDQKTIEDAIKNGAHTMDEVFDKTCAGVGACGGSCRPYIKELIDSYLSNQSFPQIQRSKHKAKK